MGRKNKRRSAGKKKQNRMTVDEADIGAARADEADDVLRVLCAAFELEFGAARPIFYGDPFFDLAAKRVRRQAGEGIVSCLTLIPSTIRVGGATLPLAGIAGVATPPAHRCRGHAGALLRATLHSLAEDEKFPLAGLFAARADYYRKFGWETASRAVCQRGPAAALAPSADAARVRPARAEDRDAIYRIYAQATVGQTGAAVRDARRWRVLEEFVPGREMFVYPSEGDRLTGYLLLERPEDEMTRVLEMHARTPNARHALVGFLAAQGGDIERIVAPAPDTPLPDGWHAVQEPGIMLRLVNLRAALTQAHAACYARVLADGDALTIRASDRLLPHNEQPLRLTAAGVAPAFADDPDGISAGIGTWTRLFAGDLSPDEACAQGRLSASTPAALALAARLFPRRAPFVAPADQF